MSSFSNYSTPASGSGLQGSPEAFHSSAVTIHTTFDHVSYAKQRAGGNPGSIFTRRNCNLEEFDAMKGDILFEVDNSDSYNHSTVPMCCATMINMDFDGKLDMIDSDCDAIGASRSVREHLRRALVMSKIRITGIAPIGQKLSAENVTEGTAYPAIVFGKAAVSAADNFRPGDLVGATIHTQEDIDLSAEQISGLSNFNIRSNRFGLKAVRMTPGTITNNVDALLAFYMNAPKEFEELFNQSSAQTGNYVMNFGQVLRNFCIWSHIYGRATDVRNGSSGFPWWDPNDPGTTPFQRALSLPWGLQDPAVTLTAAGGIAADLAEHLIYVYAAMFNLVTPPSMVGIARKRDLFENSIANAKADPEIQKVWNEYARSLCDDAIFHGVSNRAENNGCYALDDRPENKINAWGQDTNGVRAAMTSTVSGRTAAFHMRLPSTLTMAIAQLIFDSSRGIMGTVTKATDVGGEAMIVMAPLFR